MSGELVSIIIPSYKGEDNVANVVESALNQDYENIEVIVVDDNGAGTAHQIATEKALEKFENNKKFRYLKHDVNKNGSAARNTGLRASYAKYVAFLDDDDYFYPNKISSCVKALEKTDDTYAFAYTAYDLVFPEKRTELIAPKYSGDILDDFLCRKIRLCSSSVVIKKKIVDEVNGFDESFRRHQDWEFFIRILAKYKAVYVDEVAMKKVMLWRNKPTSPEMFEQYRVHFINKMAPIFNTRSEEVKNKVYDSHYFDIAKAYLKDKKIQKFFYWINKTSNPCMYLIKVIPDTLAFIKRR